MTDKQIRISISNQGADISTTDKITQVEHKKPDLGNLNLREIYDIIMKKKEGKE